MGGLLGFRLGAILTSFYDVGILLSAIEKSNTCVRTLVAYVPKCFRCKFEIPSGPVENEFFVLPMATLILWVVNAGVMCVFWEMACRHLSVCLSRLCLSFSQHKVSV